MDAAGSAVGIISLGISVCQGLLFYYDGYRKYDSDIKHTCDTIEDLNETLTLLKDTVENDTLDVAKKDRVKYCVEACETSLEELDEEKLKIQPIPNNTIQSHLKRIKYPFRQSTLQRLRELVSDVQDRLKLALDVLQLDLSIQSTVTEQLILKDTGDILGRTKNIETSVDKLVITSRDTGDILGRTKKIATSVDNLVITADDTGARTKVIESSVKDIQSAQKSEEWPHIVNWLSAPDPWTNHNTARRIHEAHTGSWLLESKRYRQWKSNDGHLWLYGKAGCGKTVLCSAAIEDIRSRSEADPDIGLAVFYFSFSDKGKQSYEALLRSLVAQLAWKGPALSIVSDAYRRARANVFDPDELNKILLTAVASYKKVFIMVDALDECPEDGETTARADVLAWIESFLRDIGHLNAKVKILATSRELRDIRDAMDTVGSEAVSIASRDVNVDIRLHVTTQLARDRRLGSLDQATKMFIEDTLSKKADGMFRWASLQLLELRRLKSMKPKHIKSALNNLPKTLDKTYERMLLAIDERYQSDALAILRWLTYANIPLTLSELADTTIISLSDGGSVDWEGRGGLEDPLEILAGLVLVIDDYDDASGSGALAELYPNLESEINWYSFFLNGRKNTIRLAHFSVKEFLESQRILKSDAKYFHLESDLGHQFLAESCLTYLMHYSASADEISKSEKSMAYPLLHYAAETWAYHSRLKQNEQWDLEIAFLNSESVLRDWHALKSRIIVRDEYDSDHSSHPLYLASLLGLLGVAKTLIAGGSDVNTAGSAYSNPLHAAANHGNYRMMELLLENGADVNAQGNWHGHALHATIRQGSYDCMKLLLDRGADVNTRHMGLDGNTVLQEATQRRDKNMISLLLKRGADVNAQGRELNTALQDPINCDDEIVRLLLDHGADPNAKGSDETALAAFARHGREAAVVMLLDAGAEVNAEGNEEYGTALEQAALHGHDNIVKLLLDHVAYVNGDLKGTVFGPLD